MSQESDLLYAVLALQMNFVTKDQMVECGALWASDRKKSLPSILEEKGYLKHTKEGRRHVFFPTVPRRKASRSELRQLLRTFFDGSVERAVAAVLDASESELSNEDLDRLARLIEQARKEEG